jgi:cellulose synthase (UDP-forming)
MTESSQPLSSRRQDALSRFLNCLPSWFERNFSRSQWIVWLMLIALLVLSIPLITTSLKVWQQSLVGVILIAMGYFIVKLEKRQTSAQGSEYLHLFLICLSIGTTLRYLYYRVSYTLNLDTWLDGTFSILLFMAELYAIATLLLAYFQTAKQRDRQPVALTQRPEAQWYKVDIYIPTYNEDVEIVRKTALAAMAIDYPAYKKRVYVLDDGRKFPERREQLRQMCRELGCTLLTRDNNDHAKAGNINTALRRTDGDLILILDCDHIPTRDILQNTVGFFYDPQVSLVQTPHWFYNPDPFERNLLTEGQIPVANELFYKVLQKGNDFWNAAFFCGSAAVIRKKHLLEVGGIAVETVTEDCHTSLRLHSKGYETIYYDKIMVAGLAPEKFSSYVGQQVRWARGMAQILRLENPLFNSKLKLSLPQRLCYLSATTHFFFGFPRMMYAIAPIAFLLFGINSIRGLGIETLAYAMPHILLAMAANYIIYKGVRYSFWNEIFEYALAFQDGLVTFMALLNPRLGKFNVTDKGVTVTRRSFDWDAARVPVIFVVLIVLALVAAPLRLAISPPEGQAIVINALWNVFNLVLLVAAILVALEQPQLRRTHRLSRTLDTVVYSRDRTWMGRTLDISESGARVVLDEWPNLPDEIELEVIGDSGSHAFVNGRIIRVSPLDEQQVVLAIDFVNLSQDQMDALILVLYSDVREWYSQKREGVDRPLESLRFVMSGLKRALSEPKPAEPTPVLKRIHAAAELYLEGQFYPARATEINSRTLRLELEDSDTLDLDHINRGNPAVGLLIGQTEEEESPKRLLAEVSWAKATTTPSLEPSLQLELRFPKALDSMQSGKIRELLNTLD